MLRSHNALLCRTELLMQHTHTHKHSKCGIDMCPQTMLVLSVQLYDSTRRLNKHDGTQSTFYCQTEKNDLLTLAVTLSYKIYNHGSNKLSQTNATILIAQRLRIWQILKVLSSRLPVSNSH